MNMKTHGFFQTSLCEQPQTMSLPPPPPPPPAPPPPAPVLPPLSSLFTNMSGKPDPGGVVMDSVDITHYMYVGQVGVYKYREQCDREEKENDSCIIFLSHYKTVVPIIQKGPLCGLVAAAMAAPLVQAQNITTEKLLETAVECGYTKQGEMFSAVNMSQLVQSMLRDPFRSEVVTNCDERQILQFLLQGDLLLIPYDADKNHSPCQKKGHKAHWMLIAGCFMAVNNSKKIIDLSLLAENEDYYERNLFHLKPDNTTTPDFLRILSQNTDSIEGVWVYGHQGKSKHTGVWTVSELLASNTQLLELGPERNTVSYIVPEGGVEEGLCGQIVRIFCSNQV
ncbi:actin maturation protease-like isoform X2 [Babylonia areolata]|uniref:actin maturation protease-like isoform X2 n=1 Tax=Babylonia areolata TaxID=304850 RepID=UPI003FD3485A